MGKRIEFLVSNPNILPRTIEEAIRLLKNSSAGFCESWLEGDSEEAQETSIEAFEMLDHIQNELLRRRDDLSHQNNFEGSQYKIALNSVVGNIVSLNTEDVLSSYLSQPTGEAAFPIGPAIVDLTLMKALNKLKHRASDGINFNISSDGEHNLFIFTRASMRLPATISKINIKIFCLMCKDAVKALN